MVYRIWYWLLTPFKVSESKDFTISILSFSRFLHVLKQVPCYLLLFLYPCFYQCISKPGSSLNPPWFCREWQVPLNRGIYTAFSYIIFITLIIINVTEPGAPTTNVIDILLGVFILSYSMRDIGTAIFLWSLEGPNPDERKFKKRYFTFWNNYNILMDAFFMIGLIIRLLENVIGQQNGDSEESSISGLSSAGRILWGVAYTFAIIKTIKIGITSKYFGPIILSINAMMMDIFMFLITFFVIMLAFACGVSYMFNYLKEEQHDTGSSTGGVFTYFFWVLLQVNHQTATWNWIKIILGFSISFSTIWSMKELKSLAPADIKESSQKLLREWFIVNFS